MSIKIARAGKAIPSVAYACFSGGLVASSMLVMTLVPQAIAWVYATPIEVRTTNTEPLRQDGRGQLVFRATTVLTPDQTVEVVLRQALLPLKLGSVHKVRIVSPASRDAPALAYLDSDRTPVTAAILAAMFGGLLFWLAQRSSRR